AAPPGEEPTLLSPHAREWLASGSVDFHSPLAADAESQLEADTRIALAACFALSATPGQARQRALLAKWVLAGTKLEELPVGRPIPNTSPEYGPMDLLGDAIHYVLAMRNPEPIRGIQRDYNSYRARWQSVLDQAQDRLSRRAVRLRSLARRELIAWALGRGDPLVERAAES